jgi:hypothetical protein
MGLLAQNGPKSIKNAARAITSDVPCTTPPLLLLYFIFDMSRPSLPQNSTVYVRENLLSHKICASRDAGEIHAFSCCPSSNRGENSSLFSRSHRAVAPSTTPSPSSRRDAPQNRFLCAREQYNTPMCGVRYLLCNVPSTETGIMKLRRCVKHSAGVMFSNRRVLAAPLHAASLRLLLILLPSRPNSHFFPLYWLFFSIFHSLSLRIPSEHPIACSSWR